MNRELVLSFSDSVVSGLHMDGFDLGFLGDKSVERATDIRFDENTQTWGLFLPPENHAMRSILGEWKGVPAGQGLATYDLARRVEVAWLNILALKELNPHSNQADDVLFRVRSLTGIGNVPPTVEEYALANC